MLVKALGLSLIEIPECNVVSENDNWIAYPRADIAVAVAIPGGVAKPIIRGADSKPISAIAAEMVKLAAMAKAGQLTPSDSTGGTTSLTNLGMFGIAQFEAIISPSQAMALAVAAIRERVIPDDGQPTVAAMISVTGSFDHRAINGTDAARLMNALRTKIESPALLLV